MTDRQVRFFRELLYPFPTDSYFTTRGFTYVRARTIKVRLDDICGPLGWTAAYTPVEGGMKCSLKLNVPDHTPDGWMWHVKEDGGGIEDIGQTDKKTGEWEENKDNALKSAFSNAFRRAAAEWGFGRELYKEGVPRWLADLYPDAIMVTPDPSYFAADAPVHDILAAHPAGAPAKMADIKCPTPAPAPSPPPPAPAPSRQFKQNFRPPTKPGKACFAWMKSLEGHFQCDRKIVDAAVKFCKSKNWGERTDELDAEQLAVLTAQIVKWIKTWDEYHGEFDDDYVKPEAPVSHADCFPGASKAPEAEKGSKAETVVDLSSIKKSILALATTLIQKQTGRDPRDGELAACVGELAAMVKNGTGSMGEVMDSLRLCVDKTWLMNIQKEAMRQIERAAQEAAQTSAADEDDIPF